MMIPKVRIQCTSFVLGIVVFLSISGLFVFSSAAEERSSQVESIKRDVEQNALDNAVQAFNSADYTKAKIGFEVLVKCAQTPEINRKALFGLASVKLVLANTPDEYEDAISIWKKWSEQVASRAGSEDPRLITPFLLRLQTSIKSAAGVQPGIGVCRTDKEIDFRGILLSKEKEMQILRSKLEMRNREIHRLRHQLESLEEIHRKYEEKKQEANP